MVKRVNKSKYTFNNDVKMTVDNNLEGELMFKVPTKVKRQFEKMRGLGPVNIGTEQWKMAKLKK